MRKWVLAAAAALGFGQAEAATYDLRAWSIIGGWIDGRFSFDDQLARTARIAGLATFTIGADDFQTFSFYDRKSGITYGLASVLPDAEITLRLYPNETRPYLQSSNTVASSAGSTLIFVPRGFITSDTGFSRAWWITAHRDDDLSTIPLPASGLMLAPLIAIMARPRRRQSARLHSTP